MIKIEVKIDDLKINFVSKGEGRNVLILPGWGTTIDVYKVLIDTISTYAKVWCLDMPGFGLSEEPKESWNVDEYVEFVIKFIESQKIKELDLIGHSNGGRIIIKLLNEKNLNFKVRNVILIGSAGIVHKKTFKQQIRIKTFKAGKKVLNARIVKKIFPNALENFKNRFGSTDYKNASAVMRDSMVKLINQDLRGCLPNIKVPTLLIWGDKDTATPIEDAYLMKKLIPDAGLVKVEGCTHYVFLERAEYVNRVIKVFINGGK